MQPGGELRLPAELAQVPPGVDERLLLDIGDVLGVSEHAICKGVHAVLVQRHERLEGSHVPRLRQLNQVFA